jgi:hypothetical protein
MSNFPKLKNKETVIAQPTLNLAKTDDVVKMVKEQQSQDVIHLVEAEKTLENCVTHLFKVRDKNVYGINGVGSMQCYNYCNKLPSLYADRGEYNEYTLLTLDDSAFDYATNIEVILSFGEITYGIVEVYLECCRFCIYSSVIHVDGESTVSFELLKQPNLIPLRHTTWSSPARIKMRCNIIVVPWEINISFIGIAAATLNEKHWFCTPSALPVCVKRGMSIFDRTRFLESVDPSVKQFYSTD